MLTQTERSLSRRSLIAAGLSSGTLLACPSAFRGLGEAAVEPQSYFASLRRVVQVLQSLGAPLAPADVEQIAKLSATPVGDVLTWGPGYYYQKQLFNGHVYERHNNLDHPEYQQANNSQSDGDMVCI
jgi:hypothetical protein